MASEQSMTEVILQAAIEAANVAVMAVRETEIPVNTTSPVPAVIQW